VHFVIQNVIYHSNTSYIPSIYFDTLSVLNPKQWPAHCIPQLVIQCSVCKILNY